MERLIKASKITPKRADQIHDSRLGIGFEKLDRGLFDPEKAYDKVAALGVKWVRIQSGWMRTEKEKGVYDFAWLDDIVDNLLSRGLRPWMNVVYGNPLYTKFAAPYFGAVGCPPLDTEEERIGWRNYCMALSEHFAGRVEYFEIWNEPDLTYSWRHENTVVDTTGTPNGTEYGQFVIASAKALKAGNKEAKVIGFALGHPRDLAFPAAALETGMTDYIDAASYHIYTLDNQDRIDLFNAFANLVHQYNPNIEIIQGESGTQSDPRGAGALRWRKWTPEKQMKFLLRLMITHLSQDNKFVSYFSAMDMVEALHGTLDDTASMRDFGYFGVIGASFDENGVANGDYYEKPSYFALQTLCTLFAEDAKPAPLSYYFRSEPCKYIGGFDCTEPTMEKYTFTLSDGKKALCYWNNVDILRATYEGVASVEIATKEVPQLIDLADGTIYDLPEDMIEKTEATVILHHIPIRDYPLMLTWK